MANCLFHSGMQVSSDADGVVIVRDSPQARLFPASGGEDGISQPVWPFPPGTLDCHFNGPRFFRRQSHGKDNGNPFRRKAGPAHFLFHIKSEFRKRKFLTPPLTFVYKSIVSNDGTDTCQNNARTSLARLADQGHPARTGAGKERLAMKDKTIQAGNSARQSRSLKVEAVGDFSRGKIIPRIRIGGQWLEAAGFRPGHRVQVLMEQPGSLRLHFLAQGKEVAQ